MTNGQSGCMGWLILAVFVLGAFIAFDKGCVTVSAFQDEPTYTPPPRPAPARSNVRPSTTIYR